MTSMAASLPVKPKRGRPTSEQIEAISGAILEAATELFLAHGFEGVAMEAVAARAGLTKNTVYKRYPDKLALLRAVLRRRVDAWAYVVSQQEWELTGDLRQRLKIYMRWMMEQAASPDIRAFTRLAVSAWSEPGEASTRMEIIGHTEMIDNLEREIRQFGPKEGIRAKEPRRVAFMIMATLAGFEEMGGADAPLSERIAFAERAVDVIMSGVAAW
jgi:AcrR family transcriptional regulator